MNRRKQLCIVLRAYGAVMLTGAPLAFIPNAWMTSIGRIFRLPPFEITPVFEYMARTESMAAALFGAALWWLSGRLDRHLAVVRFIGLVGCCVLPMVLLLHFKVDTPLYWKVGDVLGTCLAGPGIYFLSKMAQEEGDE